MQLAQQKSIIIHILNEAQVGSFKEIKQQLQQLSKRLKEPAVDSMEKVFLETNTLLASLEKNAQAKQTIGFLKQKGLYRMLYRHGKYKGRQVADDDLNHTLLLNGFIGIGLAALITLLFMSNLFFTLPFGLMVLTSALFIGASTYLGGMLFGVINSLFAAKRNLPYFLLGAKEQHISLLTTNDKIAQGVAWGVSESLGLVLMSTAVVTTAATITVFFVPLATAIFPAILLSFPFLALAAELYTRNKIKEHCSQELLVIGKNNYQRHGLKILSPTKYDQAAWLANVDRHSFTLIAAPTLGGLALLGIIGLSVASVFFPPLMATSLLFTVIIPAASSIAAAMILGALGLYMYINRARQIDNRERLDFKNAKVNYDLYLDEDRDYVTTILQNATTPKAVGAEERAMGMSPPGQYPSPLSAVDVEPPGNTNSTVIQPIL